MPLVPTLNDGPANNTIIHCDFFFHNFERTIIYILLNILFKTSSDGKYNDIYFQNLENNTSNLHIEKITLHL